MEKYKLEIILVNLISLDYLVRYQAPLPVNTLAGYLNIYTTDIKITVIDIQEVFNEYNLVEKNEKESLNKSIAHTINKINLANRDGPVIVGLSMKWATQKVAAAIINGITGPNNNILITIGNIMSTYGYQRLLKTPEFKNVLAVVGEGEIALVNIVRVALNNLNNIANLSLYSEIENVATKIKGKPSINILKRLNLEEYPNLTTVSASDIFDKEWQVHAIETSRGCPWGMCTFCSIKKQFGDSCLNHGNGADWRWKGFSLDRIFIDIKKYINQGARIFDIKDSEFFGPTREKNGIDPFWDSMNRAEQFAIRFGELNREYGITLNHISARVDTVVRENDSLKNAKRRRVYELLAKSGLIGLYLGIESGSNKQLKRFCKGVTVEENRKAIEILREIGYILEVGFIFFDPLADMEDLYNNINFINECGLYKTDSRIFGSLRIQDGTTYVKMLERKGLLGKFNKESLSYYCNYQDENVFFVKKIFEEWENATIKLIRLLPLSIRLQHHEMNFLFLRDILNHYFDSSRNGIKEIIVNHAKKRKESLDTIWNTGGLLNTYLSRAKTLNNALL
jgi:radical SAM superfamily enzyme YgiQ (UPF0313 family)